MKITDLTATRLIRLDVRDELIPLRELNYQDIRIGDILVKNPHWADEWTAIQITSKDIKYGREEMLIYDVYSVKDDKVVLEVNQHEFPYQGLLKEKWKWFGFVQNPIITLNYPEKPLNSRKGD